MNIFELGEVANAPELENLMIVDCMNFAFRYKHRGKTDFADEYLSTIVSLAKSYGARGVILLADDRHSSFRRELSESYKGGRKEKYKDQTDEEKAQVAAFFEGYEAALEKAQERFPLLRFKFVEADDTAAFLVKHLADKFTHTWLISSDKDWDLLLADNVSRFSFVTRKEYTLENFYEHHECDTPEEYISIKVLQGDSGDSVAGITGVGAKRAYNLVREHGSALDIYDGIPIAGKQKFIQNINDSGELIPLNYQLMDLVSFCEDAISHPDPLNLEEIMEFCSNYD